MHDMMQNAQHKDDARPRLSLPTPALMKGAKILACC